MSETPTPPTPPASPNPQGQPDQQVHRFAHNPTSARVPERIARVVEDDRIRFAGRRAETPADLLKPKSTRGGGAKADTALDSRDVKSFRDKVHRQQSGDCATTEIVHDSFPGAVIHSTVYLDGVDSSTAELGGDVYGVFD